MTKFATGGDPAWASAFNNIAGMYDPKVEAEGAALRAKRASLESDARYNTARAVGAEDQNSALGEAYLAAAGYTPAEIAAMRAARSGSVYDIAHGQNTFRGRTALEAGNMTQALPLLGQAASLDDYVKGKSQYDLLYPKDSFNFPLAAAIASGIPERGGNVVTLDEKGNVVLGPVTAEGKARVSLLDTQGVNDTSRTAAQNATDAARAAAVTKTGDAMVDLRAAQAGAATTVAESKAENLTNLTQGQIEYLKARGVSLADLTAARVGTETAKQEAIGQGATDKTRETDARINRINANINNDAVKAGAEAAKGTDPVKAAKAQADLRGAIDSMYAKDFSENLGASNAWERVDPAQKRSLTERAMEYIVNQKLDLGTAMKKAEADHGLTGKTVKGQKSKWFGLKETPDGKITFEGFTAPSALAAAAAAGSNPAGTPAAPTMAPSATTAAPAATTAPAAPAIPAGAIEVKTQADIDNAPSGAILIVNGVPMRKP